MNEKEGEEERVRGRFGKDEIKKATGGRRLYCIDDETRARQRI
jgi:hypothetical protein